MMKHSKKNKVAFLVPAVAMVGIMGFNGIGATYQQAAAESASNNKYYTDYLTFEEELEAAYAFNVEVAGEGSVLLKNENSALPLQKNEKNVTLFGVGSPNWQYGGYGSGAGSGPNEIDIKASLQHAGYNVNGVVSNIYERGFAEQNAGTYGQDAVELPVSALSSATDSYHVYNDAAIVVITRSLGSYIDAKFYNAPGHENENDHALMLQDNELALLKHVTANFDKVIYVINSATPLELGVLEDNKDVDAILWVGFGGESGAEAIGKILNGEINPSGKLVDVYAADMTKDPTYKNAGDGSQFSDNIDPNNSTRKEPKNEMRGPDGEFFDVKLMSNGYNATTVASMEYEENIYMGYRWYETASAEGVLKNATMNGQEYYVAEDDTLPQDSKWREIDADYYNRSTGVVYPFGYGLSYTDFEWELVNAEVDLTTNNGQTKKTSVTVKVTNTGSVAGKDVVQVYASQTDWEIGDLEKSDATLVSFAKTELLAPGASQEITITFDTEDMASWDVDKYVLEEGAWELSLRSDSHTVKDNCVYSFTVSEDVNFTKDDTTGTTYSNLFANGDIYDATRQASWMANGEAMTFTTRADLDGTFPTPQTREDVTFSQLFEDEIYGGQTTYYSYEDKESDPWYQESVPEDWKQATAADVAARKNGKTEIQLSDMVGIEKDDPRWTTFMNQMSWDEMVKMVSSCSFQTPAVESIGKPRTQAADGPTQLGNGSTFWASLVVQGCTWNVEMAEELGRFVGNESLFKGTDWYGPAMNIHRTGFDGRAFEYYSQDGIQGGMIAAAVIKGAISKGCNVHIKHFAMNEQSTSRIGTTSWATEQSMREIYFKAFELCIKAGALTTMTAFTCVGARSAPNNYALNVALAQNEWGYKGLAVTDMYMGYSALLPGNALVRANNYPLGAYSGTNVIEGRYNETTGKVECMNKENYGTENATWFESPTHWYAVRTTAMNMLYVTANTNAMDNNYDLSSFESQELKAVAGQSVKYDIAASGEVGADIISYNSDNLPEGLTLSVGGLLTGSIKQVGSYTFTVEMVADNWVTKSVDFKIEVAPVIIATGSELNATVTVGTEINTTFACSTVTEDSSLQNVTSKVIGDLPTGLTYDAETGKLSGTVTTAGVYNFTVRYSGEKQTAGGYWGRPTITEYTYDAVYTLIVEELPQEPVDYKVEVRVENGMVQYKNESGEWIDLIEVSKLNTPANDSNTGNNSILSGCIGTVSSATVVGLVTLAGAFLVAKRKEENK